MKFVSLLFGCMLVLLLGASARPERPMETVRATADKILSILSDPNLQGEAKRAERHRLVREELNGRFDWTAISRSCLGRHWSKLSREQQQEFMDLFKKFLERTYLDRIEPFYDQLDHIEYQGERILEENYASVKTVVSTKQKIDHPVEYRLQKSRVEPWRVYDVIIEGVSLVKNYRTQFDEIIAKSSYQGLVNDLKAKIGTIQG